MPLAKGSNLKIPGKHLSLSQVHNWAQAVSSAEASGASAVVVFNDLDAQAVMVGWFGQVTGGNWEVSYAMLIEAPRCSTWASKKRRFSIEAMLAS